MALDFDDLMKLPTTMKALIIGLVFVVLSYFAFTFLVQSAMDKHSDLSAKLTDLRQQIAEKEKTAAQMNRYIREIAEARESFRTALLKLPSEREIPELLASIANAGGNAGVDFIAFEPKPLEPKPPETKPAAPKPPATATAPAAAPKPAEPAKFYEELPVKVQLTGSFHSVLSFFEAAAKLPRIVNVEDIAMSDALEVRGRGRVLKTSCTLKTFMFVDTRK
jgi:type IV pilus assembly protein PilO